jgi:hypothetical protein
MRTREFLSLRWVTKNGIYPVGMDAIFDFSLMLFSGISRKMLSKSCHPSCMFCSPHLREAAQGTYSFFLFPFFHSKHSSGGANDHFTLSK